jgi:hypothetical protein
VIDKLAAFANQSTVSPVYVANGNTPWAQRYAQELRDVVIRYADRLPRNVQRHLGPSELGHHCDRQLVGKMAGVSLGGGGGNRLHDPWASVVGTALHAFFEQAFAWDAREGVWLQRWATECRVTPDPNAAQPHPGTADLYDFMYNTLADHKCQSEAIRVRLRRDGPPYHYYIQMLLYAVGYMNLGFTVDRIALISWPRTKSTLDDMYVWEKTITNEDLLEVLSVLEKTAVREDVAKLMGEGRIGFYEVPATPSEDDCQYCPFFNPAALSDGTSAGCPGTSMLRKERAYA